MTLHHWLLHLKHLSNSFAPIVEFVYGEKITWGYEFSLLAMDCASCWRRCNGVGCFLVDYARTSSDTDMHISCCWPSVFLYAPYVPRRWWFVWARLHNSRTQTWFQGTSLEPAVHEWAYYKPRYIPWSQTQQSQLSYGHYGMCLDWYSSISWTLCHVV